MYWIYRNPRSDGGSLATQEFRLTFLQRRLSAIPSHLPLRFSFPAHLQHSSLQAGRDHAFHRALALPVSQADSSDYVAIATAARGYPEGDSEQARAGGSDSHLHSIEA